jgi:hypothetical protein
VSIAAAMEDDDADDDGELEAISQAEFSLDAREWFDRFARFIDKRVPVWHIDGGTIEVRDGESKLVKLAEEKAIVAAFGAIEAMANRFAPQSSFRLDCRNAGGG